ncbi:MAG: hypothetical protein GX558_00035 [Clostridiales bacterium]|nr:hypothetical protein [Clostridiales bacterium]
MNISILHPKILEIADERTGLPLFGGDQAWYADEWRQKAGCGPTCAANVTAYLALTRPRLRSLYAGEDMRRDRFAAHMEEVYRFVTPGAMGLNKPEMLAGGVGAFARSRGLVLRPHLFSVRGNMSGNRQPVSELARFVAEGLERDCPIAFLNLTRGRVKHIQGWHWITIVSAELGDGIDVCASDEGGRTCFDLKMWYLSTRMRGGLVYFSED